MHGESIEEMERQVNRGARSAYRMGASVCAATWPSPWMRGAVCLAKATPAWRRCVRAA